MPSKKAKYLLHPSSFVPLLNLIPDKRFNRFLTESCVLDIGLYAIYQDIYDSIIKKMESTNRAKVLLRSVKQIITSLKKIDSLPVFYSAISLYGKSNELNFIDAAYAYLASKSKVTLVLRDEQQVRNLQRLCSCIDAVSFAQILMK